MNFYIINLYYELNQSIYNPINNTYESSSNGVIYLPLNYNEFIKLNNLINYNNIGIFSKLIILNYQLIDYLFYENMLKLVQKENYVINNIYIPMYYIISNIELLLVI